MEWEVEADRSLCPPRHSHLKPLANAVDGLPCLDVLLHRTLNPPDGMHHRRVVASLEGTRELGQALSAIVVGEIHGDMPDEAEVPAPTVAKNGFHGLSIVLGHLTDDLPHHREAGASFLRAQRGSGLFVSVVRAHDRSS